MSKLERCPFKDCALDHYEFGWLDEVLFLDLGLDLTTRDTQYPLIPPEDLHKARANIIDYIAAHYVKPQTIKPCTTSGCVYHSGKATA